MSASGHNASPGFIAEKSAARTPLLPLIQRHVLLKRAGQLWTGCCPFTARRRRASPFTLTNTSTVSAAVRTATRSSFSGRLKA